MLFYILVYFDLGIISAVLSYSSILFWILQGCLVLFIRHYFLLIILILVGMNYYWMRMHHLTQWQLPKTWIKKPLVFSGVISNLPKLTRHAQQFEFTTQQHRFRLNWYQTKRLIHYGEHWTFTLNLKPPSGLYNPGGFNYRQWLILNGIQAVGYVKSKPKPQLISHTRKTAITAWREQLQDEISHAIKNKYIVGLITALTVGSHNAIQSSQWQVFQKTGTNHLMAISGLHIGFVAGFGFLLAGLLWRRSYFLMLWKPVQYTQAIGAISAAVGYGLMAGFSLPTQRAVIMVTVVMLALLFNQEVALWMRLGFAFCMIVIWNPFVLYSSSLWLSFGSVAWIAYVCSGRSFTHTKLEQWIRLQVALLIGLAPLTLFYYHQVSIIGFIANAVAVPWVGFLVVPLCLLAAISSFISLQLSQYLFIAAGKVITPIWYYLAWLAQSHWAVWIHVIPSAWVLILAIIGVALLLMPQGLPGRWCGILFALPMFFYKLPGPKQGQLWVTTLDVGQGLSIVVRTQHHVLLYDAGPKSYSGFDAGASVVVPYLQYEGIKYLDTMMISHGDSDHIGGAAAVVAAIKTDRVITSVPWKFKQGAQSCYRGQHWQWDNIKFKVLWPLKGRPYADNNSSCVLKISDGKRSVLLTGDIETPAEDWLVKSDTGDLRATMLEAPHHGSKTSSTLAFVKAVNPSMVVFSTGFYNRFHFPSGLVVERYRNLHINMYNTAGEGAISVHLNASKLEKVKTTRDEQGSLL
jgi:competence protein ComEC